MASSNNNNNDDDDDQTIIPESSPQNDETIIPESSDIEQPIEDSTENLPPFEFPILIPSDQLDPSSKIALVSDPSIKNTPTSDVKSWFTDDLITDDVSESSNKETITTSDVNEVSNNHKPCDFAFILRPTKLLKHAIDALSESYFNKERNALIRVGFGGFEITVWNIDDERENNLVLASMNLNANSLEDFQCNKPLRKMFSLKGLSKVFEAAENFNKDHGSVALYSVQGSNQLSFQWGFSSLGFALGFPINVDLYDPNVSIEKFPDVEYTFEASIKSDLLRTMIEKLRDESKYRPEHVDIRIRSPSMQMTVNDVVFSTAEKQGGNIVRMKFQYWESLWLATRLADECSIYLLSHPAQTMLLRFNLQKRGDMMYLNEASFASSVP